MSIGLISWNGQAFCNAEDALSLNVNPPAVAPFCFGNDVAAVSSRWGKGDEELGVNIYVTAVGIAVGSGRN